MPKNLGGKKLMLGDEKNSKPIDKDNKDIRFVQGDQEAALEHYTGATLLSKSRDYIPNDFRAVAHVLTQENLKQLLREMQETEAVLERHLKGENLFSMGMLLAICLLLVTAIYSGMYAFNPDNYKNFQTGEMNTTAKVATGIFAISLCSLFILPVISFCFQECYHNRHCHGTVGHLSKNNQEKYKLLLSKMSSIQRILESTGYQSEAKTIKFHIDRLSPSGLDVEFAQRYIKELVGLTRPFIRQEKKMPWYAFLWKSKNNSPITMKKLEEGKSSVVSPTYQT